MRWTIKETNYLKENYPKDVPTSIIANEIRKSKKAIMHKAARLNLSRIRVPPNKPLDKNHRRLKDMQYYLKNKEKIFANRNKRLRQYKIEIANYLGGNCSRCGYNNCLGALEFHHISNNKEKSVAEFIKNSSKQKALKEAKKCILLCANCHREVHYDKDP
ncbi:hypothetical protein KA107_00780 [Candidatus Pacearchaeota archaeon]|nr:hypothetical protein [Candidatus Pacearchaeota archaeon]